MINITNLSLNTAESNMDAITGGCFIYRPKGMSSRRFAWLLKKGKIGGGCKRPLIDPLYGRGPCYRHKRTLFV